jgi:Mitochondrial biogenesis AIM24
MLLAEIGHRPRIQLSQHAGAGGPGGGGLMQGLKRVMGGGGLFVTHYEAVAGSGMVTFAAKVPGHIMPADVAQARRCSCTATAGCAAHPASRRASGCSRASAAAWRHRRHHARTVTGCINKIVRTVRDACRTQQCVLTWVSSIPTPSRVPVS